MPAVRLSAEVRAAASFELLIALSAVVDPRREQGEPRWPPRVGDLPAEARRAVERVGDGAGETWLHLLGLALDSSAPDARAFVAEVEALDPLELRRHLLGAYVPAWRHVVGAETIDRAAGGDRRAADALLASDRYYGGRAPEALGVVLPLTPRETSQRILAALTAFLSVFEPRERELVELLEEDARGRRAALAAGEPGAVITAATHGYVYEPEPEFARVVLVPHVAAAPAVLLCQHRDARLVCYPVARHADEDVAERALRLGKALADPVRIAILRALAGGEHSLTEVAQGAGIAKSTAHHHLGVLRAAGLVTVRGNARGYWYAYRPDALAEARALLAALLAPR